MEYSIFFLAYRAAKHNLECSMRNSLSNKKTKGKCRQEECNYVPGLNPRYLSWHFWSCWNSPRTLKSGQTVKTMAPCAVAETSSGTRVLLVDVDKLDHCRFSGRLLPIELSVLQPVHSSIVISLLIRIHWMKIAGITSQTSVADDIDVCLGPKIIQPLTKSFSNKLCIFCVVLPYGASRTF